MNAVLGEDINNKSYTDLTDNLLLCRSVKIQEMYVL